MTVESLTPITNEERLAFVKNSLNVTGTQFDTTLQIYIDECSLYLVGAGVRLDVIKSTLAVGCIARGVADLWNYGNGDTKLSEYFYQRAEQLRFFTDDTITEEERQRIIDLANEAYNLAKSVRDDADAGAFDGEDGITPHIGANGNWFVGETDTGVSAAGKDGYTPKKGVDYFTEADKAELVQAVLDALPDGDEVSY